MTDIALFNVRYSPNLGDGLLSECLERTLVEVGATSARSIDLAGRNALGEGLRRRGTIMGALKLLPPPLRRHALRLPLGYYARRKWAPHYRSQLEGVGIAVLGGGNLIADMDLNFPTKVALAAQEVERRKLRWAVYGVGVSGGWSNPGLALFREAFAREGLRAVFVRDEASKQLWDAELAKSSGCEAEVVRDPGLLAARHFPARERQSGGGPVAGLGIMSPLAIRYHVQSSLDERTLGCWYLQLTRDLVARGMRVVVFTNGSPEDVAFAEALRPAFDTNVVFAQPADPVELCGLLAGLDVLVAYRMHAVIGAYSYRVPAVALAWDAKLRSFMRSVGRERWMLDPATDPPEICAEMMAAALSEGIGEAEHATVIADAQAGIERLSMRLGSAE